jgi:hypothetical protein
MLADANKRELLLSRTIARIKPGHTQSIALTAALLATAALVIGVPAPSVAQAVLGNGILSSEVVGGTGGLVIDQAPARFSSPLVAAQRNMNATGQLCLNVYPSTERQIINATIYNHILILDNHCAREIKIRACYYKTDSCQEITATGNKRQRYVFGVFTTPDFRFSYREYVKPLN